MVCRGSGLIEIELMLRETVDIIAPPQYPFVPLKMRFITKVREPSVARELPRGCVAGLPPECIERERGHLPRYVRIAEAGSSRADESLSLKDAWSPVLTLKTALVSLQSLLCSPEPSDPQGATASARIGLSGLVRPDAEVARHYMNDRKGFEATARHWTEAYAKGAPGKKSAASMSNAPMEPVDEAILAGLKPEHVAQYVRTQLRVRDDGELAQIRGDGIRAQPGHRRTETVRGRV